MHKANISRFLKFPALAWGLAFISLNFLTFYPTPSIAQPAAPWKGGGNVPTLQEHHIAACTACHGAQGRATAAGYFPRLAGKPQEYLYQQLLNFRDGRRSYPLMGHLLRHLDNDYLQAMAQYFAQLQLPYPEPERVPYAAVSLQRGAVLVRHGDASRKLPACLTCHGEQLMGVLPAVPGLLGLSRDYLNAQLGAWRTGLRSAKHPDCMAQIARQLSAQDVADITAWLSSQTVPVGAQPQQAPSHAWPMACGAAPQGSRSTHLSQAPVRLRGDA